MVKHIPKVVKDFSEYTSIHGIGRISGASTLLQKVLWVILFCASLGMGIFQIYRLQDQWRSEQTSTSVNVKQGKFEFPHVSFCNQNPMKFSKVQLNDHLYQIIDTAVTSLGMDMNIFPKYDPAIVHVYNQPLNLEQGLETLALRIIQKSVVPEEAIQTEVANEKLGWPKDTLGRKVKDGARNLFNVRMSNISNIDSLSQLQDRFIVSCFFKGLECEPSSVKKFRDGEYGNCYVIKPLDYEKEVDAPGPGGGLQLTLNIDQNEYLPVLTASSGAIMDISVPGQKAIFSMDGILISPGFETNVAMKLVENDRLPGRSGKCSTSSTYGSITACIEQCLGIYAREVVGCAHDVAFKDDATDLCATVRDLEDNRLVRTTTYADLVCPHCKTPCKETMYERTISMTKWPTMSNVPVLVKELQSKNFNVSGISGVDSVGDDFAKINVYFTSLSTTVMTEEASYTDENFVSDIGGQLGLWAGVSVLSLAEIIELIFLFACGWMHEKKRKSSEVNLTED